MQIPPLLLGFTIGAYWWKVVRMARKARRRTGRSANFIPAEPLGRALRMIWVPVVVLWVATPFVVALAPRPRWAFRPLLHKPEIAWPAAIVTIACFVMTLRCWRAMGRNWRMGIDPRERNPLIVSGPFARVRHPIYALSIAMMLASMLVVPCPVMFVAGAIHIFLLAWEARREEAHLIVAHGSAYAAYRARTWAFVPLGRRIDGESVATTE